MIRTRSIYGGRSSGKSAQRMHRGSVSSTTTIGYLLTAEFQSIGCGRPPFFQQESISCQLPTDDAKLADLDDDSDAESSECRFF